MFRLVNFHLIPNVQQLHRCAICSERTHRKFNTNQLSLIPPLDQLSY